MDTSKSPAEKTLKPEDAKKAYNYKILKKANTLKLLKPKHKILTKHPLRANDDFIQRLEREIKTASKPKKLSNDNKKTKQRVTTKQKAELIKTAKTISINWDYNSYEDDPKKMTIRAYNYLKVLVNKELKPYEDEIRATKTSEKRKPSKLGEAKTKAHNLRVKRKNLVILRKEDR